MHWLSVWLLLDLSLSLSGSLWLSVTPTLALTATLWHTLALSGSLLLSNFAYTVLDRLSGRLLGFQRRCYANALSPALVCKILRYYDTFDRGNLPLRSNEGRLAVLHKSQKPQDTVTANNQIKIVNQILHKIRLGVRYWPPA